MGLTLAEAVKYVAAAYAIILIVFVAYSMMSARRISVLQRELQALEETVDKNAKRPGAE
jgi:cell division protein FtsL